MKDVELRLIAELLKDSRRSDRELAKQLKVSQPTVTRARIRLEKEGFIREYTMIPDFRKLGYEIMALTFVKLRQLSSEELEEARKIARHDMKEAPSEIILFERGMGPVCDGVIISLHKNYSSYVELLDRTKSYAFVAGCESFLINLRDDIHYRTLTLSTLANSILQTEKK